MTMVSYRVGGMSCDGCARSVTRALEAAIPGVRVAVDLAAGLVHIGGDADEATVNAAINEAGFQFDGPTVPPA
jgi:copper chaperone